MAKTKRVKRSKFAEIRHPFYYRMISPITNKPIGKPEKAMAKVRKATKPVEVTLTAEHVKRAIELDGAGRTDACAGAVCLNEHAESFPHPVDGHVDFQYSRAFVVSKLTKGLPSECVVYDHRYGWMAKLNDSTGGMEKLLKIIEREGSVTLTLHPHRKRSKPGRNGTPRRKSGARTKVPHKGAKLRYAVYKLGGYPA